MSSADILPNRPAPRKGEGLMSWLYYLAQANYHRDMGSLWKKITKTHPYHKARNLNIGGYAEELKQIADLTLLPVEQIHDLTVYRFSDKIFSDNDLYIDELSGLHYVKASFHKRIFSNKDKKFCPFCIAESPYHRIHWDLHYVTMCTQHKTLLLDQCPQCEKSIDLQSIMKGKHTCGGFLYSSDFTSKPIEGQQLELQRIIASRLEIEKYSASDIELNSSLHTLSSPAYFKLLRELSWALAHYFALARGEDNIKVNASEANRWAYYSTNAARHYLFNSIADLFTNWPHNFNNFLIEYQKVPKSEKRLTGMEKDFGPLKRAIYRLYEQEYRFFREAFNDYLLQNWAGGLITARTKILRDQEHLIESSLYVGYTKAAELMNIGEDDVLILMKQNKLLYKSMKLNSRMFYLVSRKGIEQFKKRWKNYVQVREAAEIMDVNEANIIEWCDAGILQYARIHSKSQRRYIKRQAIKKLTKALFNNQQIKNEVELRKTISINEAARLLGFKVWPTSKVLNLVLNGMLIPKRNPLSQGIESIRFERKEISEILMLVYARSGKAAMVPENNARYQLKACPAGWESRSRSGKVYLSFYRVAKLCGTSIRLLKRLTKMGIFPGETIKARTGSTVERVTLHGFIRFRREYVFLKEAARMLSVRISTVYAWIGKKKVQAISDGSGSYLLKRKEIEEISRERWMTVAETMAYTGLSMQFIHKKIKSGEIRILEGPFRERMRAFKIPIEEADRLKREADEVITLPRLAEVLDVREDSFRRLVKKGQIPFVYKSGQRENAPYFFKKKEINYLIRLMSSREVAELLGVSEFAVRKWALNGVIKAAKGPNIDGTKSYKFMLYHVQKFQEIRDQYIKRGETFCYKLIGTPEVIDALNIGEAKLKALIKQGILTPYSSRPAGNGQQMLLFKSHDIEKYKMRTNQNVMTALDAARILGIDPSHFYKDFVKTGRIKTVALKDKQAKHLVHRKDVESLILAKKTTVNSKEAAQLIGVRRGSVNKWAKAGRLRSISGPGIDGSGCYLFPKKEVMKFGRERAQELSRTYVPYRRS